MTITSYQNNMAEFKRGYEFREPEFKPKIIPWINEQQIDQNISIEV